MSKVQTIQFHPNLSCEDFIRGWRPSGDEAQLVNGPFSMVKAAKLGRRKHVVVIEEITEAIAQILAKCGVTSRQGAWQALGCFRLQDDERVYIPDNFTSSER